MKLPDAQRGGSAPRQVMVGRSLSAQERAMRSIAGPRLKSIAEPPRLSRVYLRPFDDRSLRNRSNGSEIKTSIPTLKPWVNEIPG